MIKIDLSEYKNSKIYFKLFDVILKNISITKEDFLIENDITPSSYRLSRKVEQNIGKSIIEKLANKYQLIIPSNDEIDKIENLLNNIYLDMYYKIYENYEDYKQSIDELLKKNFIIYPILQLFKLYLNANSHIGVELHIKENIDLYSEIGKFKEFYNEPLIEIYTTFEVLYSKKDVNSYMMKSFNDTSLYFVLASRSLKELKYAECIYFINMCKDQLIKENNYKRLIYLYFKLMQCNLHFNNYIECYELSRQVILMCKSFNMDGYELETSKKIFAVSAIALGQYEEVVKIYNNKENINYNELSIYLVALFEYDKTTYKETLSNYYKETLEKNNGKLEEILNIIDDYNNKGIKKLLDNLNNIIMISFIKILKERK